MKSETKKLHLVMPMGGGGTRFGNKGFNLPKPLIPIYQKPFFYWAVQSVRKYVELSGITFVVLKEHMEQFAIGDRIHEYFPFAKVVVLPKMLNGAVLTCLAGCEAVPEGTPVLFNDCDHLFLCREFYEFCERGEFKELDGALLTFESNNPAYSYAALNEAGYVIRTVEKEAISNEAICGAYYFQDKSVFQKAAEVYLEKCSYQEYFVSGVYNVLADWGSRIKSFHVSHHVSYGTPEEYDAAQTDRTYGELVE